MVGTYLRQLTFRHRAEIDELDAATATDPGSRRAQRVLAHDVVALVHGESEAEAAELASQVLFTEGIRDLPEATLVSVLAEAPSTSLPRSSVEGAGVVDLLVRTGPGVVPERGPAGPRSRAAAPTSTTHKVARRRGHGGARGAAVRPLSPSCGAGKATQHLVQVT